MRFQEKNLKYLHRTQSWLLFVLQVDQQVSVSQIVDQDNMELFKACVNFTIDSGLCEMAGCRISWLDSITLVKKPHPFIDSVPEFSDKFTLDHSWEDWMEDYKHIADDRKT